MSVFSVALSNGATAQACMWVSIAYQSLHHAAQGDAGQWDMPRLHLSPHGPHAIQVMDIAEPGEVRTQR
eukprot:3183913-Amphidinium_carterae.3